MTIDAGADGQTFSLTNNGTITGPSGSAPAFEILWDYYPDVTLSNNESILATGLGSAAIRVGQTSSPTGSNPTPGVEIKNWGTIAAAPNGYAAIEVTGVSAGPVEIDNFSGGTITGGMVGIVAWGQISTLNNFGEISSDLGASKFDVCIGYLACANAGSAIFGPASLETFNNLQGYGNTAGAVSFAGNLPSNYNVVIYGDTYGQLAVDPDHYQGAMTFGIFGGDQTNGLAPSQLSSRIYSNVITGIASDGIENFDDAYGMAVGVYDGVAWKLYENGEGTEAWDLGVFNFGLDMAEPQRAMLERRQQATRSGLDYDCTQFDTNGLCVSIRGRYSDISGDQEGAGVLTVSKRIDTGLRAGVFVDGRVAYDEASGTQMKVGLPMFGLFAAYSDGKDNTGLQVRISGAYEHGKANLTHSNMVGSASTVTGNANVDSYGLAQRMGWGFDLGGKIAFTPYLGIRYVQSKRGAYEEVYAQGVVDDPLTFDAYGSQRLTGTAGFDLDGRLGSYVRYHLGGGVDYDFANTLDTFKAYSSLFGDLTYTSIENARDLRVFGSAGLGLVVGTNGLLTLDGNVSQMDFGNDLAYSALAGFQMGF